MKRFTDEQGTEWVASAVEEDTVRHYGRWYMVFERADNSSEKVPVPEVRWQNRPNAQRTLDTMSEFELRRRLVSALKRYAAA
jgi:hypothetical protein